MLQIERDRKDFDLKLFEMGRKLTTQSESFQKKVTYVLVAFAIFEAGLVLLQLAYPAGMPWLMKWFGNMPVPYTPSYPAL